MASSKDTGESKDRTEACLTFRDTGTCKNEDKCMLSHNMRVIQESLDSCTYEYFHVLLFEKELRLEENLNKPVYPSNLSPDKEKNVPVPQKHVSSDTKTLGEAEPKKCEYCQKCFDSLKQYSLHIDSQQHKSKLRMLMEKAPFFCRPCLLIFNNDDERVTHLQSQEHVDQQRRNLEKAALEAAKPPEMYDIGDESKNTNIYQNDPYADVNFQTACTLCEIISFSGPSSRIQHLKGKKHQASVKRARSGLTKPQKGKKSIVKTCELCKIDFDQIKQYESHLIGKRHLKENRKSLKSKQPSVQQKFSRFTRPTNQKSPHTTKQFVTSDKQQIAKPQLSHPKQRRAVPLPNRKNISNGSSYDVPTQEQNLHINNKYASQGEKAGLLSSSLLQQNNFESNEYNAVPDNSYHNVHMQYNGEAPQNTYSHGNGTYDQNYNPIQYQHSEYQQPQYQDQNQQYLQPSTEKNLSYGGQQYFHEMQSNSVAYVYPPPPHQQQIGGYDQQNVPTNEQSCNEYNSYPPQPNYSAMPVNYQAPINYN